MLLWMRSASVRERLRTRSTELYSMCSAPGALVAEHIDMSSVGIREDGFEASGAGAAPDANPLERRFRKESASLLQGGRGRGEQYGI